MQVFKATITAEPSPDEAPEGPDDMWTERLANKWKEIEIHVRRLEQVSGAKYDPDLEVPGVMANLAKIEKKTKDKTKSKWSQFKRHFTDTLTVISKVGGMAAEAASQVSRSIRIEKESVTESKPGIRSSWAVLQCYQFCHHGVEGLHSGLRSPE